MADKKELDFADIRAGLGQKTAAKTPEPEEKPLETAGTTEEEKPGEEKAPEGEEKQPEKVEDKKDKRFSKLTKERDTAKTERDAERAARVALEARLTALESGKKPEAATATADGKPEKPNADKFATYKEYEAAKEEYDEKLSDWKVAQALAKKENDAKVEKAKQAWENTNKAWQSQVDDATEENDDIEDAIKAVGESVGRKGIIEVIKESPVGIKMVLYLHRNPAELAKIDDMTVATAARYLGRVEERLEREAAPAATSAKPAGKALPKPPAQVGGGPSSVAKGFDFQNASDSDFKAMLLKQDGFSYLKRR